MSIQHPLKWTFHGIDKKEKEEKECNGPVETIKFVITNIRIASAISFWQVLEGMSTQHWELTARLGFELKVYRLLWQSKLSTRRPQVSHTTAPHLSKRCVKRSLTEVTISTKKLRDCFAGQCFGTCNKSSRIESCQLLCITDTGSSLSKFISKMCWKRCPLCPESGYYCWFQWPKLGCWMWKSSSPTTRCSFPIPATRLSSAES